MIIRLHKEGKTIIPVSFLLIALIVAGAYFLHPLLGFVLGITGLLFLLIVLNFFRNPDFPVAVNENHILAPCDGTVVVIEEVQDEVYFHGPVRQISIFMSPLNVHVNRNPISGTIRFLKYYPGKYLMAFNPKSSQLNEQTYMVAENARVTVGYKQIAGFLARRIKWYIAEKDEVEQGAEYGFIRFGSRIDLLLPLSCEVKVALGDKTRAGRTVVAEV
jgi:phosphatidylserine decarboxylase